MPRGRVGIIAFAILAALLVTTAQPAAAAHTTGLASINTTDTDFSNATSLTGLEVTGTGSSASLEYPVTVFDGFNDGDLSEWNTDSTHSLVTSPVYEGSHALEHDGSSFATASRSVPTAAYTEISWALRQSDPLFDEDPLTIFRNASGTTGIQIGIDDGTVVGDAGSVITHNGSSWVDTGIDITDDQYYFFNVTNIDYAAGTFDLEVEQSGSPVGSASSLSFRDSIDEISTIIVRGTGGQGDVVYWDAFDLNATGTTGTYISQTHTAQDAQTGFTNLTLSNADATVTWIADTDDDGTFETTAAQSTFTASGNQSLDISAPTSSTWRVNVTITPNGSSPIASVHDEGIMATTHAPSANDATASPNSTTDTVDSVPVTLSVDINDTDFPTSQGDSVTAEFFVNGSSVGTDTATTNGTVSVSTTPTAGDKAWHVNLTDDYGHSVQSSTYEFVMPGELELRNESDPDSLVTGANAEITFYFQSDNPLIETRSDANNDGRINMTGLPADEYFIVVANASGYLDRRIYVNSLLDTQRVFLLPSNADHVDTIFELQDFSGLYPSDETAMEIQRALNLSGSVDWRTVEGDYFGATSEFSAQLATNQRHRLVLHNTETGDSKVAGTYTPLVDATKTIKVFQNGTVTISDVARVSVRPDLRALPAKNNVEITVQTVSDTGELAEYNTTINLTYPNGTEVQLATLSGTQASGETLTASVDLSNGSGGRVDVNTSLTQQDGTVTLDNSSFFVHEYFANQYNLLSVLGDVETTLPSRTVGLFTNFIALILSVLATAIAASRMPLGTEGLGLVFLGFIAAFVVTGWADVTILFAGSVGWVAVAGTRRVI